MLSYTGYPDSQPPDVPVLAPNSGRLTQHYEIPAARRDFEYILEQHGVWMIHVRLDKRFACQHCTPETVSRCGQCLGTGYKTSVCRTRVMLTKPHIATIPEGNSVGGLITNTSLRAYFPVNATPPLVGNLLLEVIWNVSGINNQKTSGEPRELLHVLAIEQCEAQYWSGALSFYSTQVEVQDSRLPMMVNTLRERIS